MSVVNHSPTPSADLLAWNCQRMSPNTETDNAPAGRDRRPMGRLLFAVTCLFSWLAMMAVHEFGHVLHASLSGGTVQKVILHPLAISRTDIAPNPHPLFAAWGGPIWGCLLPLLGFGVARRFKLRWSYLVRFFCGFCLIANGAYLGCGGWYAVGDARDLLRHGTPAWLLVLFGVGTIGAGLWMWNGLGKSFGLGDDAEPVEVRHLGWLTFALLLLVFAEALLSEQR